jgi:hypothetical protein
MNSLDQAREIIAHALDGATHPIVCWSGGKDSQLLLKLASEVNDDIPVLWFRSVDRSRRRFAESFIADTDLTAYSWEPADRYVLPSGEGMSLIEEFSFGNRRLPLISDIVQGERCTVNLSKERVAFVNYDFDVTLTGSKACDSHPLIAADQIEGVIYPLWHMADEEVWIAIREMEIPIEESVYDGREADGPSLCTRCLSGNEEVFCPDARRMIPPFVWNSSAALAAFNTRFARAA